MYFILIWLILSGVVGVISLFREGYFIGPFIMSIMASPLIGFMYATRLGFDQEDNLMA